MRLNIMWYQFIVLIFTDPVSSSALQQNDKFWNKTLQKLVYRHYNNFSVIEPVYYCNVLALYWKHKPIIPFIYVMSTVIS